MNEFINLEKFLQENGAKIIDKYRTILSIDKKDASGNLGNSISYEYSDENGAYELNIRIEDYFDYVENGRRAGRYPNLSAIKNWIRIKNIAPKIYNGKLPSLDSMAYLIGRKIAKNGIPAGNQMSETIKELNLDNELKNVISQDIETDVDNIFSDNGWLEK